MIKTDNRFILHIFMSSDRKIDF